MIMLLITIKMLHKVHLKSLLQYTSNIPKYREREREREREILNLTEGLLLNYVSNVKRF